MPASPQALNSAFEPAPEPMRILVVKTSSLGDIVHTLPALSDAALTYPGLRCDWLVERAFVEIPRWHPAVGNVIACDLRGWRRHPLQTAFGGDWRRFRSELRARQYDCVIDAQGLLKSAWLARAARGPLAGPDRHSAREPLAAWFYDRGLEGPAHDRAHAVVRLRRLFAQALQYPLPQSDPDAGLDVSRFPRPSIAEPYAVLLHGTSWPSKRWPVERWSQLAAWLGTRGLKVVLPWGNDAERRDAETIAVSARGAALILPRSGLTELAGWLAHADVCIGVDTGLAHLAAALGRPQVSLYGPTQPELTGTIGRNQLWLRSGSDISIDRSRPLTVEVAEVQQALAKLLD